MAQKKDATAGAQTRPEKQRYHLYLTKETHDRMRALADAERRPLGVQIDMALEEHLASRTASKA